MTRVAAHPVWLWDCTQWLWDCPQCGCTWQTREVPAADQCGSCWHIVEVVGR